MSRRLTRTFHPRPPGPTGHDTERTLGGRLASHSARQTRVQLERDGWRVLPRTGPGGTS
jgi:hypothetical protein